MGPPRLRGPGENTAIYQTKTATVSWLKKKNLIQFLESVTYRLKYTIALVSVDK